jgi:hypothetical protein
MLLKLTLLNDKYMGKVRRISTHYIIEVEHNGITYECTVSYDFKDLFECTPKPKDWVEIENIIREAAWNGEIENFNENE